MDLAAFAIAGGLNADPPTPWPAGAGRICPAGPWQGFLGFCRPRCQEPRPRALAALEQLGRQLSQCWPAPIFGPFAQDLGLRGPCPSRRPSPKSTILGNRSRPVSNSTSRWRCLLQAHPRPGTAAGGGDPAAGSKTQPPTRRAGAGMIAAHPRRFPGTPRRNSGQLPQLELDMRFEAAGPPSPGRSPRRQRPPAVVWTGGPAADAGWAAA
jgi:hypothetical protein